MASLVFDKSQSFLRPLWNEKFKGFDLDTSRAYLSEYTHYTCCAEGFTIKSLGSIKTYRGIFNFYENCLCVVGPLSIDRNFNIKGLRFFFYSLGISCSENWAHEFSSHLQPHGWHTQAVNNEQTLLLTITRQWTVTWPNEKLEMNINHILRNNF